jgi:hypothetical protein
MRLPPKSTDAVSPNVPRVSFSQMYDLGGNTPLSSLTAPVQVGSHPEIA